jgi:hypothetical protein
MDAPKPWKNVNLRDLYNCPWFFGQLSEENATEILTEALQKDGNLGVKIILFLKTVNMPSGENQFTLVSGHTWQHDVNGKPRNWVIFLDDENCCYDGINADIKDPFMNGLVKRKNPFSLEELGKVSMAASGVVIETLVLPETIKNELKKYQALNESFISAVISNKLQIEIK